MNIRPLHDRVVVRRLEEETTSAGGIVLPDSATEKPSQGEILAVGSGKVTDSGDVRAMDVKVGDKVIFGQYAGSTVKVDGEELLILSESEIFGVLKFVWFHLRICTLAPYCIFNKSKVGREKDRPQHMGFSMLYKIQY